MISWEDMCSKPQWQIVDDLQEMALKFRKDILEDIRWEEDE